MLTSVMLNSSLRCVNRGPIRAFTVLGLTVFTATLCGCGPAATENRVPPAVSRQVRVAPELTIELPRPADFGRAARLVQLVTARYGDKVFSFEGYLQIGQEGVLLTCVDSLGRVAMSVTWNNDSIAAKKGPTLPTELLPENILADIVLLFWPEPAVRRSLAGSGADLVTTPGTRSIRLHGREVIHAEYSPHAGGPSQPNHMIYSNIHWGYSLDIQSRELPP